MLKKILNIKSKYISLAALILSISSFLSAVLGLLRDRLLLARFGASIELDIYYSAFLIPDFVNMVLIMGAISAAIIPIFTKQLSENKKQAKEFVANLFNVMLVVVFLVSLILFLFTPQLISLIAPGFEKAHQDLAVLLTRIMFLSPLILGISNVISAILQVFTRFFVTALAPLFYNLGIIFGILFLAPKFGLIGLAGGVVLGAFCHLFIQLPVFFSLGFKIKRVFRPLDQNIKKVVKFTLPRSLSIAASQINFMVITAIASTLTAGSITIFHTAFHFYRHFLILLAVPFSTAAFPFLSLAWADKQKDLFLNKLFLSARLLLFLTVPVSCLVFVLRNQILAVVFRAGQFNPADVNLAGVCLAFFILGLFANGLVLLLSKAFYAIYNTRTPALISIGVVILNICLSLAFIGIINQVNSFFGLKNLLGLAQSSDVRVIGLALALTLSTICQYFLLFYFFKSKVGHNLRPIVKTLKQTLLASILTAGIVFLIMFFLLPFHPESGFLPLFTKTCFLFLLGIGFYFVLGWLLQLKELALLTSFLQRKFLRKSNFVSKQR